MDFLAILRIFSSFNLSEFAAEGEDKLGCTAGKPATMEPHQTTISFSALPSARSFRAVRVLRGRAGVMWLAGGFSASSQAPPLPGPESSRDPHAKKITAVFAWRSAPSGSSAQSEDEDPPPGRLDLGSVRICARHRHSLLRSGRVGVKVTLDRCCGSERAPRARDAGANEPVALGGRWERRVRAETGCSRARAGLSQPAPVRQSLGRALLVSEARGAARRFEVKRIL